MKVFLFLIQALSVNLNNKRVVLFLFIALWVSHTNAVGQDVMFALHYGNGKFKMDDMHQLVEENVKGMYDSLRVTPEILMDYPAVKTMGGYVGYRWKKNSLVVNWSYYSTGSRIDYADYSGRARVDRVLTAKPVLVTYRRALFDPDKPYNLLVGLGFGKSVTINESNTYFDIYISEEEELYKQKWRSNQTFLQPEVRFQWFPIKIIFLELKAGYLLQIKSTDQEFSKSKLTLPISKSLAHPGWAGMKVEAGIGIRVKLPYANVE